MAIVEGPRAGRALIIVAIVALEFGSREFVSGRLLIVGQSDPPRTGPAAATAFPQANYSCARSGSDCGVEMWRGDRSSCAHQIIVRLSSVL